MNDAATSRSDTSTHGGAATRTRRRSILSATCLAALLATASLSGSAAASGLDSYQPALIAKTERALEHGEPARALALLNGAEASFENARDRAEAHGLRCRAELELGDPAAASAACHAAIDARGGAASWRFHNNLGVAYLRLARFDRADAAFRTARTLNPRSTIPRRNLRVLDRHLDGATGLLTQVVSDRAAP